MLGGVRCAFICFYTRQACLRKRVFEMYTVRLLGGPSGRRAGGTAGGSIDYYTVLYGGTVLGAGVGGHVGSCGSVPQPLLSPPQVFCIGYSRPSHPMNVTVDTPPCWSL